MKFLKSMLYVVAVLVLVIFLVTLSSVNGQHIHINFLIAQDDFSLSVLLIGAFFSGFVVASAFLGFHYMTAKFRLRRLTKQVNNLSAQTSSEVVARD